MLTHGSGFLIGVLYVRLPYRQQKTFDLYGI